MMMRKLKISVGSLLVLALFGCAGGGTTVEDSAVVSADTVEVEAAEVEAVALGFDADTGLISGENTSENLLQQRIVYFPFDSSDPPPVGRQVVQAHAEYLVNNPFVRVVLEGHTDERGTRAYNLSLGDRRATAVANILRDAGVADERIETISYGEENTARFGSGESNWRYNRRVEIHYQ